MENKQIMKEAQESLKGKWGISIAACLIAGLITIMITIIILLWTNYSSIKCQF